MDGAGVGRLGKRKYDFVIIWKKKLNYQDTLLAESSWFISRVSRVHILLIYALS